MSTIPFVKTQSIGNDFVLFREEDVQRTDLAALSRIVCARHFGIGSDGILVVGLGPQGVTLRMFNPDGTEDFCGNGLRCAGLFASRRGLASTEFTIRHGGLDIPTTVNPNGNVSIVLPPADFRPAKVPVLSQSEFIDEVVQGFRGTAVSTGSAHFVTLVESLPDDEVFFKAGPAIEHDPLFPEHISTMFTTQIGEAHLQLRIWERGAGETLGCGTGSAAAAVVWARKKGHKGRVTVSNPGGDVLVEITDWTEPVVSETKPELVFEGEFDFSRLAQAAGVTNRAILA